MGANWRLKIFVGAGSPPLRTGACLPLKSRPLPTTVTMANLIVPGQTVGA